MFPKFDIVRESESSNRYVVTFLEQRGRDRKSTVLEQLISIVEE